MSGSRSDIFYDDTILPAVVSSTFRPDKLLKEVGSELKKIGLGTVRETKDGRVVWKFDKFQGADHGLVMSTLLRMDSGGRRYSYDLKYEGLVGAGTRTILVVTFSENVTEGLLDGKEEQLYHIHS